MRNTQKLKRSQSTIILDEITQKEKLPIALDNRTLAQVIVAMIEGGTLMTKNSQDSKPLVNIAALIRKMVNSKEKVSEIEGFNMVKILGISGSPVPNSNVDQTIQAILAATGEETRFFKLSEMNVRPCRGCLGCAADNHCCQADDFTNVLEELVHGARALVIGGYPPFGAVDAFTKAFMERLYSLRHRRQLLEGKLGVAVAGGYKGNEKVKNFLENFFKSPKMVHCGTLVTCGNATCLSCGFGDDCSLSNVPLVYGAGAQCSPDKFANFSHCPDLQAEAQQIGYRLKSLL